MEAFSLVVLVTIAGGFYVKIEESWGGMAPCSQLGPSHHRRIYLPEIKEGGWQRERNGMRSAVKW